VLKRVFVGGLTGCGRYDVPSRVVLVFPFSETER
jgi:hypothetical protein